MIGDILSALLVLFGLGGEPEGLRLQGYVEGDYVRIAPPSAGLLAELAVREGQRVAAGAPLFALDRVAAIAARDEAAADLAEAEAQLADLQKGKRPEELAVIAAQQDQAQASLRLSLAELARQKSLARTQVSPEQRLEQAEAAVARDRARVAELAADYQTALLAARPDQIAAAAAMVEQRHTLLAQAQKRLDDLSQTAPVGGLVEDTYYDPGEFVSAGSPVVSLLPEQGVKLVFFVPEPELGALQIGQLVAFACDGCPPGLTARISRIASQAEYTPPVIYSVDSRQKLVFRVEARPTGEALVLHPGQPVDVTVAPP